MTFDGSLADAKIDGDVLAWGAGEYKLHHLALSRCQGSVVNLACVPECQGPAGSGAPTESAFDAGDELFPDNRLFDKIQSPGLKRLDRL